MAGRGIAGLLLSLGLAVSFPVTPSAETLIDADNFEVNSESVLMEIEALPEHVRDGLVLNPDDIRAVIFRLYDRMALLNAEPAVDLPDGSIAQYRVQRAKDRELVKLKEEAVLAAFRQDMPDFELHARELYTARRDRYVVPERFEVRHILLAAVDDETRAVRRVDAERLYTQVKASPELFAALAAESSDDESTAGSGGMLPPFGPGIVEEPFERGVRQLAEDGNLIGLVETNRGWHIIKLESYQPSRQKEFSEVRDMLITNLRHDYLRTQVTNWKKTATDRDRAHVNNPAIDEFVSSMVRCGSETCP